MVLNFSFPWAYFSRSLSRDSAAVSICSGAHMWYETFPPQRQPAFSRDVVRCPVDRVVHVETAGIPQCRDALARHVVEVLQQPFLQLVGIRHEPVAEVRQEGELLDPPGGLAILVTHEVGQVTADIRRVAVDAEQPQEGGIDPDAVPGMRSILRSAARRPTRGAVAGCVTAPVT